MHLIIENTLLLNYGNCNVSKCSQSFSLTECIVIVGVRKTGVVSLSVCVCVCLSVCLSVCLCVCGEPFAETTRPISTKLTQMGFLMF